MNSLEIYIQKNQLDPVSTMNRLMEAGIISDNAVEPKDVAYRDCFEACLWLQKQPSDFAASAPSPGYPATPGTGRGH